MLPPRALTTRSLGSQPNGGGGLTTTPSFLIVRPAPLPLMAARNAAVEWKETLQSPALAPVTDRVWVTLGVASNGPVLLMVLPTVNVSSSLTLAVAGLLTVAVTPMVVLPMISTLVELEPELLFVFGSRRWTSSVPTSLSNVKVWLLEAAHSTLQVSKIGVWTLTARVVP